MIVTKLRDQPDPSQSIGSDHNSWRLTQAPLGLESGLDSDG